MIAETLKEAATGTVEYLTWRAGADRECVNSTDTAHRTRATKGNHKCNRNLRPRRIFRH